MALVAALAFQVVFMVWQIAWGPGDSAWDGGISMKTSPGHAALSWELGPIALWHVIFGVLLVVGASLTIGRSPLGHLCGALLYLAQLVQVDLEGGGGWRFAFTPTITFRISSEMPPTVAINLVALVLLVLTVPAMFGRRLANELAANPITANELLKSR